MFSLETVKMASILALNSLLIEEFKTFSFVVDINCSEALYFSVKMNF